MADKNTRVNPEVLQRLSEAEVKRIMMRRFRTRNAVVGLTVLAAVFGVYTYTMWAVKQESFLDEEFDKVPPRPSQS